ncbi:MAG: hypothetical protein JWQ42_3581 [Edaphobacter sp.]|nr:hypothetical protein [Edaphobacter sp.]
MVKLVAGHYAILNSTLGTLRPPDETNDETNM